MATSNQNKNKGNISDDEILGALRKAVLDSIGDSDTGKKAIQKIATSDDLSNELKNIGRRLVRKQSRSKSETLSLTAKDIEKIKAIADVSSTVKVNASKKSVPVKSTSVKKKIETRVAKPKKVQKKTFVQPQPVGTTMEMATSDKTTEQKVPSKRVVTPPSRETIKGIGPVQALLPAPTFKDRIGIIFTKKRVLASSLALLLVLLIGIPAILYMSKVDSPFAELVAQKFDLPVAKVNGEAIGHRVFLEDVTALQNFFADQSNVTSYDDSAIASAPSDAEIRELVLDRHIRVLLIRQALTALGQTVTNDELQSQLDQIILESGGREELSGIVADLYGWTIEDFVEKALRPLLEEERLSIYVASDDGLNSSKKVKIDEIAALLADGTTFETLARQYSEDVTADVGGDLDWFEAGVMVPAFEEKVVALEVGEVTEPFKTGFGWHIATLTGKEEDENGQERYRASHILINFMTLQEYLETLKSRASIEILIDL